MRVGVIGGGLQGVGIALELALRGVSVDVFEKRDACLGQASLQNEGKIHLGFVYAKDRTLATARLMAEGALRFEPTIKRWLETGIGDRFLSSPFQYFVHKDSLLDSEELGAYYEMVSGLIRETAAQPETSYFGREGGAPVRKLPRASRDSISNSPIISAIYQTPELAIDPRPVAELLRARIAEDKRIQVHPNAKVSRVTRGSDEVTVTVEELASVRTERYDHVVNASWEDLLAIDASAGIAPGGEWSFRVKHFLRIPAQHAAVNVPSATVVLGGFGDVVRYAIGDLFLSWYPVGRRGFSTEIKPPDWPMPLDEPGASEVRAGIPEGLRQIFPCLRELPPEAVASSEVYGGIIYALGATDVGDPSSQLHQRHQAGVRSFGRYHRVDTGKYTLAPLFAKRTAERITGVSS